LEKTHIIIVDDHKIVRDGLKALLLGEPGLKIIGEASSGYELLDLLKEKTADILLLDVSMPGMSGIELTKIIGREYPGIRVLILSANDDKFTLTSALKAGALAYLSKEVSKEELIEAIGNVARGKHYLGTQMHKAVFESLTSNNEPAKNTGSEGLTDREKDIIKLFAEGFSYKQIAEKLFISVRTVESHKKNILEKLHLDNTIDLVKFAIQEGLIKI
jgi:DNA-binding NarL/FixJ family response regulator